jgi:diguanylate cyclase (GGDEF)-like protein/PAS domain S-box-containing protein
MLASGATPERFDPDNAMFWAVLEHAVGPLVVLDADGRINLVTTPFARALGLDPATMRGRSLVDLTHADDVEAIGDLYARPVAARSADLTCRLRRGDGWLEVELAVTDLRQHAAVNGLVLTIRDSSHRRLADEALVHNALHDPLTGLPNRALLLDRLGQALARANRGRGKPAVLFLDLDNFKVVNDSLGHLAGDLLLIELAHRLLASVRAGDTVARFGGDEFAVLLEGVADGDEAVNKAEQLANALRQPLEVDGREVRPNVSIGVALSSGRADQPEDMLRRADLAMYQAKGGGKARCAVFEPAMQARADARLELETGLRQALERDELRVHFQPILSLETGLIKGLEALVRWARPGHGLVPPAEFVPVAEDAGLITPLGQWVLTESCRQLHHWQTQYPHLGRLGVSVNISPRQLRHPSLVADVARTLHEMQIDPGDLTLEITESALVENAEETIRVLHQLKAVGVKLAIDDFGTGYSSLSYLRRLPVDTLKIDRSFVNGLGENERDDAIVRGILELAGTLQLTTTAEGIETDIQLATVRRLGGTSGQGFLFARPLTPEDIDQLLACNSDNPPEVLAA